jgi:hypothetical protein
MKGVAQCGGQALFSIVPFSFYTPVMPIRTSDVAAAELSAVILNAPAWARVGLTMPDREMRERAAQTLAETILEELGDWPSYDDNQLALKL